MKTGSRDVPLDSAFNVRDLGGLGVEVGSRVRRGRAFRGDGLHRLSAADVATLSSLGITQVFDLRSASELARDGTGPFAGPIARHVHVPLVRVSLSPFDPEIDWRTLNLRDRYLDMLEEGQAAIRTIVESLAGEDARPLIFHCSGGKDRTGVVAALILRAIGVEEDVIVSDYSMSERNLARAVREYREHLETSGLGEEALVYLTSSPPERMRYTLTEIDRRWGSTHAYLRSIGLGESTLAALSRNLVEPAGEHGHE